MPNCYVPGCMNDMHSCGLCVKHYQMTRDEPITIEAPISLLRLLLADARQCYRNASCLPDEREAWRKRAKDLIRQINTLITLSKGDPISRFVKEANAEEKQ